MAKLPQLLTCDEYTVIETLPKNKRNSPRKVTIFGVERLL